MNIVRLRESKADLALDRVAATMPTSVLMAYVKPSGEVEIDGAIRNGDDGFGLVGALKTVKSWMVDRLNEER